MRSPARHDEHCQSDCGHVMSDNMGEWDADRIAELEAKNASLQAENTEFRAVVGELKRHLSIDGDYSIRRYDGETLGLGDALMLGDIFERLDTLLQKES